MKITFSETMLPKAGALLVFSLADTELLETARLVDQRSGGALSRAIGGSRFTGKKEQLLEVMAPAEVGLSRVVVYGLGEAAKVDALTLENAAGDVVQKLLASGERQLAIAADGISGGMVEPAAAAAALAFGARLGGYRFDKYHTKPDPEAVPSLETVTVGVRGAAAARRAWQPLDKVADGVYFARDLVSEPANVVYPESLAKECRGLAKLGLTVEVLGEAQMRRLGMNALLAVGQGSARESQMVVMQWRGGPRRQAPLAFVGKGVCFDSGGLSLKTAPGMEDMKWDMGGAAAVIGTMRSLAAREAKANVVGVVGLVENMPSGTAMHPGDVLRSMSGQTMEVLNTDAEGRVVLSDLLWYTQDRFKPQFMIDVATLTGAIIVALGHEYGGLFSNNDELAERLMAAGRKSGEEVWRMPMGEAFDKMLESPIADMCNIGNERGVGGSIIGAQFLQRFVNDVPWAHLDIAGTVWLKKDKPTIPKGSSGYGVRLLNRLVADFYEAR